MATANIGLRVSLEDGASAGLSALHGNLMTLGDRVNNLANQWNALTPAMQGGLALIAGGGLMFKLFSSGLEDVISSSADLQDAMIQVGIAVQGANERSKDMQDTLIKLDTSSVFTSTQVAEGFTVLGKNAFTASDIIDNHLGAAMVNYAEVTKSDVAPAAEVLANSLEVFGAKSTEATHYADVLTYAFYHGIPSIEGMHEALQAVGGKAHSMGISIDELSVVLDQLGKNGLSASTAGTSLRYMLDTLSNPTAKATTELAHLGIIVTNQTNPAIGGLTDKLRAAGANPVKFDGTVTSLKDLYDQAQALKLVDPEETFYQWGVQTGTLNNKLYDSKGHFAGLREAIDLLGRSMKNMSPEEMQANLSQLFTVRGGQGANILLSNLDKTDASLNKLQSGLQKYSGSGGAGGQAAQVTDSFNQQMKALHSTLDSTAASMGAGLLPPLTNLISSFNKWLGDLRTAHPHLLAMVGIFLLIGTVLSALAVGVGIIMVIGAVLSAVGIAVGTIAAPILIVIGAIIGIALLAALIIGYWGPISSFFVNLWHTVSSAVMGFIGATGAAIQSWVGAVGAWFQHLGNSIKTHTVQAFNSVIATVTSWGNGFRNAVVGAFNATINTLKGWGTGLLNGVKGAFNAVVNFVRGLGSTFIKAMHWLYDHNYYVAAFVILWNKAWQKLVALIHQKIETAKANIHAGFNNILSIATGAWNAVAGAVKFGFDQATKYITIGINFAKGLLSAGWAAISSGATAGWNAVSGAVRFAWNAVSGAVSSGIAYVRGIVSPWLSWAQSAVGNAWNGAVSGVHTAWNGVSNAVQGGVNNVKNIVHGIIDQAFNFGSNFINMLIQGINSGLGALGNAASNAAAQLWKNLGFHSPTKEGPASDSHTWMPNFINMMVSGLNAGESQLAGAAFNAANKLHQAFASPAVSRIQAAQAYAAGMGGAAGGAAQQTHIHLEVGGKEIGTAVLDHITGQLKMNGIGRAWR